MLDNVQKEITRTALDLQVKQMDVRRAIGEPKVMRRKAQIMLTMSLKLKVDAPLLFIVIACSLSLETLVLNKFRKVLNRCVNTDGFRLVGMSRVNFKPMLYSASPVITLLPSQDFQFNEISIINCTGSWSQNFCRVS